MVVLSLLGDNSLGRPSRVLVVSTVSPPNDPKAPTLSP